MKQGNEFWYGIKIKDENGYIDIEEVNKIVFNFNELQKTYTEVSIDVKYESENNLFKIYLTQEETLLLKDNVKIDARVKFKNDEILGVAIQERYIFESLNKEVI